MNKLNKISGKPVVRHLRDYEDQRVRLAEKLIQIEEQREKKHLDKATEMTKGEMVFPSTAVFEDKSCRYRQLIRLKSLEEFKKSTAERKELDKEILRRLGIGMNSNAKVLKRLK